MKQPIKLPKLSDLPDACKVLCWVGQMWGGHFDDLTDLLDLIEQHPGCHHRVIELPAGHPLIADDRLHGEFGVLVIWTGDPEASDRELAGLIVTTFNY